MEFIKCYEFVKFMYIITFKSLLDLVRCRKRFISSDDFIDNFSKIVEIYACFLELYFIYSQQFGSVEILPDDIVIGLKIERLSGSIRCLKEGKRSRLTLCLNITEYSNRANIGRSFTSLYLNFRLC